MQVRFTIPKTDQSRYWLGLLSLILNFTDSNRSEKLEVSNCTVVFLTSNVYSFRLCTHFQDYRDKKSVTITGIISREGIPSRYYRYNLINIAGSFYRFCNCKSYGIFASNLEKIIKRSIPDSNPGPPVESLPS